jgi:hypothetical protein
MYTPKSGLLLLVSCVAAIAAVGSSFDLYYGEPPLGTAVTTAILTLGAPLAIYCLYAAIQSVREGS